MKFLHLGSIGSNVGDHALLLGLQRMIREQQPRAKFDLWHIPKNPITANQAPMINSEYNTVLCGGGGLLYCPRRWLKSVDMHPCGHQLRIQEAALERIEIPIIVYGVGVNVWRNEEFPIPEHGIEHIHKLYERADYFSVRNDGTKETLNRIAGIEADEVPDPGLYAPHDDRWPTDEPHRTIALQVAWDKAGKRFGKPTMFRAATERFIIAARNELNMRVILVPHIWPDFMVCRNIARHREADLHDIYFGRLPQMLYDAQRVMQLYRTVRIVIGMRGHSVICPFGQNTTTIGINCYEKIEGFMRSVGFGNLVVEPHWRTLSDDLIEKVRICLENETAYAMRRREVLQALKDVTQDNVSRVLKIARRKAH